jgi:Transposase DNA-binding
MEARSDLSQMEFGLQHFQGCDFGDARLTRRAVLSAAVILKHPGGTLPHKLPANELLGFYRLVNNSKVTHQKMLQGHQMRVFERIRQAVDGGGIRVLLLISDTTELDWSGLESADLGSIGNGGGQGLLCHNVLAYDFDRHQVIGLANQVMHKRRDVRKGETARQKREDPQRESRLWKRALVDFPAPPQGQLQVNICDRGSDTFENIEFWESQSRKYVIRSKSNRKIDRDQSGEIIRLHDLARGLNRAGRRTIEVSENHGQPGRLATVEIAYSPVVLPAPKCRRGEHSDQPAKAWVVHVRELIDGGSDEKKEGEKKGKGPEPLEWVLLTNVPVNSCDDAWERVDWYSCRPVIEEYHKAQKTGCGVEELQFTTRAALEAAVSLLSVVAVQLLIMRDMSRDPKLKDQPATTVIDPIYVQVLSIMRFKKKQPLSVSEFFFALAYLGGHLNRRTDKPPGWLILWRGWIKLQPMVAAVEADRRSRCV